MQTAPFLTAPLRSWARHYAARLTRRQDASLALLESLIRQEGEHTLVAPPLPQRWYERWLFRMATRLEADGLLAALRRGHYRALRGAEHPAWRSYQYRGFHVKHDIRQKSQWDAYIHGRTQAGVAYWLERSASPGATVLDIGANAGVVSLDLARAVGQHGTVHAFEPNPQAYQLLRQAVSANGLEGCVEVHTFALGDEDATTTLSVPASNDGAASLREPGAGERSVTVQVRRFSGWWEARRHPRIDVIKLDVEGFEARVINGLEPVLMRDRPVVVMELNPGAYDAAALLEGLRAKGYDSFRIMAAPPYFSHLLGPVTTQTDVVCLPRVHGRATGPPLGNP
ncbi:FkbM family methyltransferase [Aquisalimonas sp.]|uniref:FkbM family methyltransferase n=1 Tax=Aquisalimonas sp. TaxID=1872621 RepID=UPI0025C6CC3F|nr:FkbM family methyltransferase [Aquisalimonas sp.]